MLPLNNEFSVCDWSTIPETEHPGEAGAAYWKEQTYGDVRVRIVRYTPGYRADHWCGRGHVLFVLQGELTTQLQTGEEHLLLAGQSYTVADGKSLHRSKTATGATLFIVD